MGRLQEAEEWLAARDFRLHSHNVCTWTVSDKAFPGAVAHTCVRGLLDAAICERWLAAAIVPLPALRAIVFWLQHNQPSLCPLRSAEVSARSRLALPAPHNTCVALRKWKALLRLTGRSSSRRGRGLRGLFVWGRLGGFCGSRRCCLFRECRRG